VTGGKRSALGGTFFEPTVLTDMTTDMVITKEETFGPVAPLHRFKTDDKASKWPTTPQPYPAREELPPISANRPSWGRKRARGVGDLWTYKAYGRSDPSSRCLCCQCLTMSDQVVLQSV
jgi:hypothetical protein